MTKKIPLTQGFVAIVDDEDYDELSRFKWYAQKSSNRWYARRSETVGVGKQKKIPMHRQILDAPDGMEVDHMDGNGLNNTRANLRLCTHQQNNFNRKPVKNTASRFKGVYWHKPGGKWRARIEVDGKTMHLGMFDREEDAAAAYDAAARDYHGEFARINIKAVL